MQVMNPEDPLLWSTLLSDTGAVLKAEHGDGPAVQLCTSVDAHPQRV